MRGGRRSNPPSYLNSQSDDYYHIGSNTKVFTGFLAAKIVEDDLIEWDTKFFDLYPELKKESNTAYYNITLKELLSHRVRLINLVPRSHAAMSENIKIIDKSKRHMNDSLGWPEKRYYLIKEVLKYEPLLQIFATYPSYSMGCAIEPKEMLRYSHRGSNMMFLSFAGILPYKKTGIVIMMNAYNEEVVTKTVILLWKNYANNLEN